MKMRKFNINIIDFGSLKLTLKSGNIKQGFSMYIVIIILTC